MNILKKYSAMKLTHACMFSYNIQMSLEQEELLADLLATYGQEIVRMTNCIFGRLETTKKGCSVNSLFLLDFIITFDL